MSDDDVVGKGILASAANGKIAELQVLIRQLQAAGLSTAGLDLGGSASGTESKAAIEAFLADAERAAGAAGGNLLLAKSGEAVATATAKNPAEVPENERLNPQGNADLLKQGVKVAIKDMKDTGKGGVG